MNVDCCYEDEETCLHPLLSYHHRRSLHFLHLVSFHLHRRSLMIVACHSSFWRKICFAEQSLRFGCHLSCTLFGLEPR